MTVGEKIEEVMQLKGMSRRKLSEITNLSEASISRYINGEREPRSISLAAIARALNVTVDDLMGVKKDEREQVGKAVMLIARNAKSLSTEDKKTLMNALIGE